MPDKTQDDSDKPRDKEEGVFVPETSTREILDVLEELGEENVTTSEVQEKLDYTAAGAIRRLEKEDDYVEKTDLGNNTIWSLKYTRSDFLGALDELEDLTGTDEIAEYVGCSEEVAKEWMFKLEDEEEVVSTPRGPYGLLWAREK